jgi:hypothetical protein
MIINTGGNGGVTAESVKYDNSTVAEALGDLEYTSLKTTSKLNTIDSSIDNLEAELTANGKRIYLDYQNGQYGYNTDSRRGADTFSPFSGTLNYNGHSIVAMYFSLGNKSIYYEFDKLNNMVMIPMVKNIETDYYTVSTGNNLYQWNITAKQDLILFENNNTTGIAINTGGTYFTETNFKLVTLK